MAASMSIRPQQLLVPLAQMMGVTGAGCLTGIASLCERNIDHKKALTKLSGLIASFSVFGVPAVLMAPADLAARQWRKLYVLGKASMPPLAIMCSACFAFLAYQARGHDGRLPLSPSALYTAATVCLPLIVPYTLGPMHSTVHALEAKADSKPDAPREDEVKGLVQKWSAQNLHRALIVGTGAVLGGIAVWFS